MAKSYRGSDEQRLALGAWVRLARATSAVEGTLQRSLDAHGLTLSQFGVLEALYHLGPLCQSELAEKILRTGGNLTLLVDKLEGEGLVRRARRPEDRRYVEVQLTAAGEGFIRKVFPGHAQRVAELFRGLSPTDQRELARLSRKLVLGLREEAGV